MIENKDVIIRKDDKYTLYMDIFSPEDGKKNRPCVMWIHGGAWCVHELTRTYIPKEFVKWIEAGYVVASCEYRLSDEAIWPAQIEDCRYSLNYLKENSEELGISKENIFVWGESAGGHLTTFIANDGEVAGACIWYPPIYYKHVEENTPDYGWIKALLGKEDFNTEENLAVISPLFTISEKTAPCLVMHGNADKLVNISQSELLVKKLKESNVDVTYIEVPGQDHGFFNGEEYYDAILEWMNKRIQA